MKYRGFHLLIQFVSVLSVLWYIYIYISFLVPFGRHRKFGVLVLKVLSISFWLNPIVIISISVYQPYKLEKSFNVTISTPLSRNYYIHPHRDIVLTNSFQSLLLICLQVFLPVQVVCGVAIWYIYTTCFDGCYYTVVKGNCP